MPRRHRQPHTRGPPIFSDGLILPLLASFAGGISFAATHHFFIGVRAPREKVHLTFAALCALAAVWVVWGAFRYTADTPVAYLLADRWRQVLGHGMGIFFIWFLAFYTGFRPSRFLWSWTGLQLLLIVLALALPFGTSFTGMPSLEFAPLPWGETATSASGPHGTWWLVGQVAQLVDFGFGFLASGHLWRSGQVRDAGVVLVALALLFGGLFDLWSPVLGAVPTTELAFLALIGVMSLAASARVVEAGTVREQLTQSEQRLRALVETAPEAVMLLDGVTGIVLDANDVALELLQVQREDIPKGLHPAWLSPPGQGGDGPSAVVFERRMGEAFEGNRPVFPWVVRGREGREVPCEARLVRLPGPEPTMVRLSLVDMADLEEAERTRIELEAQLRQSQRLEAVGRLTGGLAHDFNNYLAAIQGNLELLGQEPLGDEAREFVGEALSAARRSGELTSSLLSFARRSALAPRPIEFGSVARDLSMLLERSLGDHIEIQVYVPQDLWMFHADPAQLESTILNLSLNARDAMPRGGRLRIDARNVSAAEDLPMEADGMDAGDRVAVTVADEGAGMTPDVVARAFEPFFTTKGVGHGSGLGLSMVYGFVAQSGGAVSIDSAVGEGTTVWMFFPRLVPPTTSESEPDRS